MLPDKLEPATSPRHRKFWHSLFVGLSIIGLATVKVFCDSNQAERAQNQYGFEMTANAFSGKPQKYSWFKRRMNNLLVGAAIGYVSHLAMDLHTKARLPII